jgi:hypothetical protein
MFAKRSGGLVAYNLRKCSSPIYLPKLFLPIRANMAGKLDGWKSHSTCWDSRDLSEPSTRSSTMNGRLAFQDAVAEPRQSCSYTPLGIFSTGFCFALSRG